jgi:hypothetical protein
MYAIRIVRTSAVLAATLALAGCGGGNGAKKPEAGHDHAHGHKAAHGGCLNAIGSCETGHAEVKVDADVLKLWLVGGANDTDKAVRVPDAEIVLSVKLEGEKQPRNLALKAKPSALLEEKPGDCSCFEARADWLKGVRSFEATGTVTFKGRKEKLEIDYPHGHDPDHGAAGEGHGH